MKKTIALVLTLTATPAFAQDPADTTEYRFDDADQVDGDRPTTWGDRLQVRSERLNRRSLVRPRTQFHTELLTSVEDI